MPRAAHSARPPAQAPRRLQTLRQRQFRPKTVGRVPALFRLRAEAARTHPKLTTRPPASATPGSRPRTRTPMPRWRRCRPPAAQRCAPRPATAPPSRGRPALQTILRRLHPSRRDAGGHAHRPPGAVDAGPSGHRRALQGQGRPPSSRSTSRPRLARRSSTCPACSWSSKTSRDAVGRSRLKIRPGSIARLARILHQWGCTWDGRRSTGKVFRHLPNSTRPPHATRVYPGPAGI